MLLNYRNEKFTVTPLKAQMILAQHGTEITLEDAEIMLELLRKICKLSVSELLKTVDASENQVPNKGNV